MKTHIALRSIAVISLVLSWLTASMAPGLLVHFSVGSRMLISANRAPIRISEVSLAMIRGELCGFAVEVTEAEEKKAEDLPLETVDGIKIVLSLVEVDSPGIVPQPTDLSRSTYQQVGDFLRQPPPGPPPKVS